MICLRPILNRNVPSVRHPTKSKSIRQATTVISRTQLAKSFNDIPSPSSILPSSLSLMLSGGPAYLHEHCDRRHLELGPIYRENLGPTELVFLSDTKLIQKVVSNEGQYPQHNIPAAWTYYNRTKKIQRGLFFQAGESWARSRQAFNKVLLADSKRIAKFNCDIIEINKALFRSWKFQSRAKDKPETFVVDRLKDDLCKWSIESTGFMLFGSRLNSIPNDPKDEPDFRAEELVKNVSSMFTETSKFQVLPVELAHRLKLPAWRRFEQASDEMIRLAEEYTNEFIHKAKQSNLDNSLIGDLIRTSTLTDEEISRSVVDLLIAAADTTSNSLQWMLYVIAREKAIQDEIYNEIKPLLSSKSSTEDFKDKVPYLKAFMREVHRLYPTAPFIARTLDCDVELGGYCVPAGKTIVFSLFTASRSKSIFRQPLEFKPERWLRSTRGTETAELSGCPAHRASVAYASLPFGIGKRMCIGRKIAELQMSLLIGSFVNAFESSLVKNDDQEDIGIKLKMILTPTRPIKLILKPRCSTD